MNTVLTTDAKGGISKSLVSELVSSAAVGAGLKVARADTDTSNSSFKTIYPDAKFIVVAENNVKAGGDLAAAILDAADWGPTYSSSTPEPETRRGSFKTSTTSSKRPRK